MGSHASYTQGEDEQGGPECPHADDRYGAIRSCQAGRPCDIPGHFATPSFCIVSGVMDEAVWFDNGPWREGTPLDAYPIIADFTVEPAPDVPAMFGVQMRWVSPTHGILSVFPWWDHLEWSGNRLDELDWSRPWTQADPFIDADQNFSITMWVADDHVYVVSGLSSLDAAWYRVPVARFESELARFRSGLASGDIP